MTQFQFRIFHPVKPKGWNLTRSEKMSYYSLVISLAFGLVFSLIEKKLSHPIDSKLMFILILGFLVHIAGIFVRLTEYENLNGYFEGYLILKDESISIHNTTIPLKDITDLELFYFDYNGRKTNNGRYGPMYTNGIGNQIILKTADQTFDHYFEIGSEVLIYQIEQYLYSIVINKKIPLTKRNLELVPKEFRDSKAYLELLKN